MTLRHCFEFGQFRVDLLTHRLLRDGDVVALQPKAFDTLVVLIQNRGRVVERAVLMHVCPKSAPGPNIIGQAPAITLMSC